MDKSISITSNVSTTTSMEKIDHAASWISATVISAFFTSLERCACVNLSTSHDDEDDDDDESHHRPLALSAAPHPNDIV
ncbi:unnamed protein product [Arabidopsis thaliana]|uniref:Uncharacterized protein n=2 Tax=Arabidopsis TaxID=3701 RepID=A0A8T2EBU9_9BRAS|nr:hypothetical protein ISN45_At04g025250 [Arabidopsis thaliana x Arabidopsis arenosa]CAA0396312.1 unnamed protein product [Arabidopsis thaliana]CAD5328880.1 unnamed protein product [Arabidopsis thaliana]VYS63725.1 unnamed protein product [Arabidopsis thaliana]